MSVDNEAHAIRLDQTAFYPGGGGQVPDKGLLRFNGKEARLARAKHGPEGVLHFIEAEDPLAPRQALK